MFTSLTLALSIAHLATAVRLHTHDGQVLTGASNTTEVAESLCLRGTTTTVSSTNGDYKPYGEYNGRMSYKNDHDTNDGILCYSPSEEQWELRIGVSRCDDTTAKVDFTIGNATDMQPWELQWRENTLLVLGECHICVQGSGNPVDGIADGVYTVFAEFNYMPVYRNCEMAKELAMPNRNGYEWVVRNDCKYCSCDSSTSFAYSSHTNMPLLPPDAEWKQGVTVDWLSNVHNCTNVATPGNAGPPAAAARRLADNGTSTDPPDVNDVPKICFSGTTETNHPTGGTFSYRGTMTNDRMVWQSTTEYLYVCFDGETWVQNTQASCRGSVYERSDDPNQGNVTYPWEISKWKYGSFVTKDSCDVCLENTSVEGNLDGNYRMAGLFNHQPRFFNCKANTKMEYDYRSGKFQVQDLCGDVVSTYARNTESVYPDDRSHTPQDVTTWDLDTLSAHDALPGEVCKKNTPEPTTSPTEETPSPTLQPTGGATQSPTPPVGETEAPTPGSATKQYPGALLAAVLFGAAALFMT